MKHFLVQDIFSKMISHPGCWIKLKVMWSFSWRGREKVDWSQLKASLNNFHVMGLPSRVKHLGFFVTLLFSMLFLIFLKLCWKAMETCLNFSITSIALYHKYANVLFTRNNNSKIYRQNNAAVTGQVSTL